MSQINSKAGQKQQSWRTTSFTVVLQLYYCFLAFSFFSFTTVLQICCCSSALLLFYSFANCSSALTTVKLENNSKDGEK
jgi:hypothetical protein